MQRASRISRADAVAMPRPAAPAGDGWVLVVLALLAVALLVP